MNADMLLAVQSYPGANGTVARHYPYWLNAGASRIVGIATAGGGCEFPNGMDSVEIGINCYIKGTVLGRRLLDSIAWMLTQPENWFALIEYDTIFLREIPEPEPGTTMFHAGSYRLNGIDIVFYHNPWIMDRGTAERLLAAGERVLRDGRDFLSSPDVFMGWMARESRVPVHQFRMYTRNTLGDLPNDIAEARQAVKDEVVAIHGIKTKEILDRILSP